MIRGMLVGTARSCDCRGAWVQAKRACKCIYRLAECTVDLSLLCRCGVWHERMRGHLP